MCDVSRLVCVVVKKDVRIHKDFRVVWAVGA
jgi:hypothetical protein